VSKKSTPTFIAVAELNYWWSKEHELWPLWSYHFFSSLCFSLLNPVFIERLSFLLNKMRQKVKDGIFSVLSTFRIEIRYFNFNFYFYWNSVKITVGFFWISKAFNWLFLQNHWRVYCIEERERERERGYWHASSNCYIKYLHCPCLKL